MRTLLRVALLAFVCLVFREVLAESLSVEGGPAETGYDVGSTATIRVSLKGLEGDAAGYAVFADIQYVGATAVVSVEMDRQPASQPDGLRYEAQWPIPADAPTGLYSVQAHIEDRSTRQTVARRTLRSFAIYKKLVRVARLNLDKTFYAPGETIQCEVVLDNLTDREMTGLRVEFSNANYPWISTFSGASSLSGKQPENPALGLSVLRDNLALPARATLTLPMMPAGTAAFLQGTQVAVLGAGGPARHEKLPPPEVDQYTVAVWNAGRTVLYDMQFSPQAIVRDPDRDLPKPYSHNFTHPYNSDIDFTRYREFYAPAQISAALRVDHARTLYRPGEQVTLKLTALHPDCAHATIKDPSGHSVPLPGEIGCEKSAPDVPATFYQQVWKVPPDAALGVYSVTVTSHVAQTVTEIAVNRLPRSLLVFCPHEDDEHPWAGLIRAMVEAGLPTRVVFFTGGDVGACERYYSKPCGPNEAREFGMVRMEESAEALEHIGLTRDKLTFLGLPDGGSGAIWSEHLEASSPFLSIYLATDHAPYENVLKPNLPYARATVIDLVKQIIRDSRPAMIATPHPDERHVDHRTANWFVIKACQELLREKAIDPQTVILADQAYGAGGFKPAPYHYEKYPVYLSGETAALKQEMGWIYQSQDGNIDEGMRKTFAELPRQEVHYRIVDWQEHEGWNE